MNFVYLLIMSHKKGRNWPHHYHLNTFAIQLLKHKQPTNKLKIVNNSK